MKQKREGGNLTPLDAIYRLLLAAVIIMVLVCGYEGWKYYTAWKDYNSIPEMSDIPATEDLRVLEAEPSKWPDSSLFVEKNRAEFTSGALRLIIPKMGVDDDVMDGTDRAVLKHGPGLYTVAQMPSVDPETRANTSIAAHRAGYGRYGNLFKEIEDLGEGDLCYLRDSQWIYIYEYRETKITTPEDISVLYLRDYPCLTLTSCHPLGKNYQRIVVFAEQIGARPVSDDFAYPENVEGLQEEP